ncbi:MAG: hypothetical protein K0R20_1237 [Actinomycetia bacterium]|nr:hypothetical protein [Actinomycetes bacterium]
MPPRAGSGAGVPAPSGSGRRSCGASTSIAPPMIGGGVRSRRTESARRSERSLTRNRIVAIPPIANSDEPVIAATTWILIQYELSAGCNGLGSTGKKIAATASVSTENISEKPVRVLILATPSTRTSVPTTTRNASTVEYSNMLPQGTRCAATPRDTIDTRLAVAPAIATRRATLQSRSRRAAR